MNIESPSSFITVNPSVDPQKEPRHVPESTKVCPKPVKESLLPSRDIFFKETPGNSGMDCGEYGPGMVMNGEFMGFNKRKEFM